jgi:hypothetical protein
MEIDCSNSFEEDDCDKNTKTEYDIAIENEERIFLAIDQIGMLYDRVIKNFQDGNDMVFNPNIFAKLTKDRFINWVILNNDELYRLING